MNNQTKSETTTKQVEKVQRCSR